MDELAVLPQELIDCIIDFLQDSQADLLSCAKVSRAWLPQSRKHIFSSVRAHIPIQLCQLAAQSFTHETPYLSTLVHSFRVDFNTKIHCDPSCSYAAPILKDVLSGSDFSHLRRLFISYLSMTDDMDPPYLLPTAIATLTSLEHCTFSHFDITTLQQFLILPTRSTSLRSLAVHDVSVWTSSADDHHQPTDADITHIRSLLDASTGRIHLTALDFSDIMCSSLMDMLFSWPNACFPWHCFRKIFLDQPHPRFRETLQELGPSLTHLGCSCSSIRPNLDLLNESVLPALTHLNIMSDSWPWGSDFFRDVLVHLITEAPFKKLTHLVILAFEGKVTKQIPASMDSVLARFAKATPSLRRILVVLQFEENEIHEEEMIWLLKCLPKTVATDLLEVTHRSRFECESLYWEDVCPW